jgi:argininosuccinate lyase
VGLSRVTHDLLVRATQETNALRIDDSFIQISSIMPQKRNPVVLEHLRARLSRALGYAQTVVLQCHSIPYGDTQDIEDEIMPPLVNALATMQECVELYASVMSTVTLNEAHLRRQAGRGSLPPPNWPTAWCVRRGCPSAWRTKWWRRWCRPRCATAFPATS